MKLSYKQYCDLRTLDKSGSLLKLSKYKRENPTQHEIYHTAYDEAFERIVSANNRGFAVRDRGDLITTKTILANTKGISDPDKAL